MSCRFGYFHGSLASRFLPIQFIFPSSLLSFSLSLSLSLSLFSFLGSIVLSLYSTPPVWFSQRNTSVYLSISVCPVFSHRRLHPHTAWTESSKSPSRLPRIPHLAFQVEQSISILQEFLLNLESATHFKETWWYKNGIIYTADLMQN